MTNEELKAALISQKPVVVRSNKRDALQHFKCVTAIRYVLDNNGEIAVQAELLDNNSNSVTITKASEVFYNDGETSNSI